MNSIMTNTERAARKYHSISYAFEDGAEYMLKRVLKHLENVHPDFYQQFGEEILEAMEE